jgi:hypothetical protein
LKEKFALAVVITIFGILIFTDEKPVDFKNQVSDSQNITTNSELTNKIYSSFNESNLDLINNKTLDPSTYGETPRYNSGISFYINVNNEMFMISIENYNSYEEMILAKNKKTADTSYVLICENQNIASLMYGFPSIENREDEEQKFNLYKEVFLSIT